MNKKLKDCFWLWGQNAGSHHAAAGNQKWKLPGVNRMTPREGAEYLGINRMCRVVMCGEPKPPFDADAEELAGMAEVVWSAIGDTGSRRNDGNASDLDEVLRQAESYPNVTGAVLDDFFKIKVTPDDIHGRHTVESIRTMRERLAGFPGRPLDLWVVWYKRQLGFDLSDYLPLFDVITYWNMGAPAELNALEDDIATVVSKTPGKRRFAGFYMWNYEEGKPLTRKEAEVQWETYLRWMERGDTEGIIFCSNCCADLGLEAVEWIKDWIQEIGDTPFPAVRGH